jgi:hypothetical protein
LQRKFFNRRNVTKQEAQSPSNRRDVTKQDA